MVNMKTESVIMHRRLDEFVFPQEKASIFDDPDFWALTNSEFLSEEIMGQLQNIRGLLIEFIKDGYSEEFCMKNNQYFPFFRRLALQISKHNNIIPAFIASKSWKSKFAFEMAKGIILSEFKSNGNILTTISQIEKSKIARSILREINSGNWNRFDINTWEDFLKELYGPNWYLMVEFLKLNASEHVVNHFPHYPQIKENNQEVKRKKCIFRSNIWDEFCEFSGSENIIAIYLLCQNGFYENIGIYSWHDFLYNCIHQIETVRNERLTYGFYWNHQINQKLYQIDDNNIIHRYQTLKGLEIVRKDLKLFYRYFGRSPTQFDFKFVLYLLDSDEWKSKGITSWEDLMKSVFTT